MKVNLIVTATGPNNGRAIPIIGAKFLIGRDPQCHLRPASQAVSKMHCAILIRDGKVFAEDFGSTNGTQVNNESFTGERELHAGDSLKIGPLEFKVEILPTEKRSDSTPLPDALKPLDSSAVAKLAAAAGQVMPDSIKPPSTIVMQKPAGTADAVQPPAVQKPANNPGVAKAGSGSSPAAPTKPASPPATKKPASTPGVQKSPVSASGTVPSPLPRTPAPSPSSAATAPVPPAASTEPVPIPTAADTSGDSSDDIDAAAMLLGMDDDPSATPQVPEGSTIYDIPAVNPDGTPAAKKPDPKKKAPTGAEMSAAANDILRKYIRRTGN